MICQSGKGIIHREHHHLLLVADISHHVTFVYHVRHEAFGFFLRYIYPRYPKWAVEHGDRDSGRLVGCDPAIPKRLYWQCNSGDQNTYTRLNRPRIHSSRAFSSVNHKLSSTRRLSLLSSVLSNAAISPVRMALMKGIKRSLRTGKRSNNSSDGRYPFKMRRGMRYVRIRLWHVLLSKLCHWVGQRTLGLTVILHDSDRRQG